MLCRFPRPATQKAYSNCDTKLKRGIKLNQMTSNHQPKENKNSIKRLTIYCKQKLRHWLYSNGGWSFPSIQVLWWAWFEEIPPITQVTSCRMAPLIDHESNSAYQRLMSCHHLLPINRSTYLGTKIMDNITMLPLRLLVPQKSAGDDPLQEQDCHGVQLYVPEEIQLFLSLAQNKKNVLK